MIPSNASSSPSSLRNKAPVGTGSGKRLGMADKAASFHGRIPTEHRTLRRPKTQPDLLAGRRPAAGTEGGGAPSSPPLPPRVPAKVLVNVTVQRSLGAVQVVASTDWTVGELVGAALRQYAKEGRRPLLPSADASAYGLHYSQFSLESLDPEEKLIGLGSRNFFLCPNTQKSSAVILQASEDSPSSSSSPLTVSSPPTLTTASSCSNQAEKTTPKIYILPWLKFMDFLL